MSQPQPQGRGCPACHLTGKACKCGQPKPRKRRVCAQCGAKLRKGADGVLYDKLGSSWCTKHTSVNHWQHSQEATGGA